MASSFDICSVAAMAGLQDLVDELAQRLGRPVSIDDRRYRVLAYSAHAEPPDPLRLTSILTRAVPADVAAWLDERGLPGASGPVRLPANPPLGMGPRVAIPIRGEGLLGFLWLFDEAVSADELAAAEVAAAAAAPELARLRVAERTDHALVGDLLGGDTAAREGAARSLRERGLRGPVQVLAGDDLEGARRAAGLPRRRLAIGAGAALLAGGDAELADGAAAGTADGDAEPAAKRAADGDAELAAKGAADGDAAAVGVSAPRERLEDAHEALAEARAALALAAPLSLRVARWERLGAYALLAPLAGAPLPEPLRRLLAHPDAEPLVATLEAYLDRAGDARGAAAALFIHRTSLYHRLHRIEAITGTSLRDGEDRLLLHIALRIRRLRGLR